MHTEYFKWYSTRMGREMECKLYGHAGRPFLFVPCQDGRFFDFENFKMADVWQPWIDSGKVTVFAIDTVDKETWSDLNGDSYWRARRYEQWIDYIVYEVVPLIRDIVRGRGGPDNAGVTAFGCSLGALHAANLAFRYPDHFTGLLALSGIYTAEYGFGSYMDEVVYRNSPVNYMADMPHDHYFIGKYNRNQIFICAGQGAWERPETTCRLRDIFAAKGINAWVDLWGGDVFHDWDWWFRQVAYFLPRMLGEA